MVWDRGSAGRGMDVGKLYAGIEIIFGVVCCFGSGVKFTSASRFGLVCGSKGAGMWKCLNNLGICSEENSNASNCHR